MAQSVGREPAIVCATVALSLVIALVGVLVFDAQTNSEQTIGGCPVTQSPYVSTSNLSPTSPVLLPECAEHTLPYGIEFTIASPINLTGSWASTVPLQLGLFNLTASFVDNGWASPCSFCDLTSGSFAFTLFPGTYAIGFEILSGGSGPDEIVATQPFTALFDRGLDTLQLPETVPLPPNGYSSWPISLPPGTSNYFLEESRFVASCSDASFIFPPAIFQEFQTDRGVFNSAGVFGLGTDYVLNCTNPEMGGGYTNVTVGPLPLISGDVLVFWNSSNESALLDVLAPLEISFLAPLR
jgi:hypothetical protein